VTDPDTTEEAKNKLITDALQAMLDASSPDSTVQLGIYWGKIVFVNMIESPAGPPQFQ